MTYHSSPNNKIFKNIFYIAFAACLYLISFSTASAKTMISDSAGFLTREEAAHIEETCDMILQQYNTSVFIITTDKLGKKDDYEAYLKKQSQKVDSKDNLVILFISTKKKENVCHIVCKGDIQEAITDSRIKRITGSVENMVNRDKHYEAIKRFCDDIIQCLTVKPSLDGFIFQSIPQLLFCLLAGAGIVFYLLYPGKKSDATLDTYLDKNHALDLGHLNHFSHKEVRILKDKTRKKETEDNDKETER